MKLTSPILRTGAALVALIALAACDGRQKEAARKCELRVLTEGDYVLENGPSGLVYKPGPGGNAADAARLNRCLAEYDGW